MATITLSTLGPSEAINAMARTMAPAITAAGSPGATWISTKATVATTMATGISDSSRRRMYVFTAATAPGAASAGQPDVPEEELGRGAEPAQLLAGHVQQKVV